MAADTNRFELTDDGTMDTVVRCTLCGAEVRFTYDGGPTEEARADMTDAEAELAYDDFVTECLEDADADHTCEDADAD